MTPSEVKRRVRSALKESGAKPSREAFKEIVTLCRVRMMIWERLIDRRASADPTLLAEESGFSTEDLELLYARFRTLTDRYIATGT